MNRARARDRTHPGRARRAAVALAVALLALPGLVPRAGGNALPAPLRPFVAEYEVGNGSITLGSTTIALQPRTGGWRYRSVTEASGLLSLLVPGQAIESTVLEPHGDWVRPLRYRHVEPDEEDNVTVEFDWARGEATARHDKGTRRLALEPDTVDGFSATLWLVRALAEGRDELQISTIDDKGKPEILEFRRMERERIEVPLGTFDTVRVERVRRDSDRETVTWLAPSLSWVAVRIDQRDDGELEGRLLLTNLEGEAAEGLGGRAQDGAAGDPGYNRP